MSSHPCRRVLLAIGIMGVLLPSCQKKEDEAERIAAAVSAANKVETREIRLFYEGADGLLAPEDREVALPRNDAAAVTDLLRTWLAGSSDPAVPKPFPPDTTIRGAYLLPDGYAVVDLDGETLAAGWQTGSHAEMMAAYGLVQTTAANIQGVRKVRILVRGQAGETLGGHLDLRRSLAPRADLIRR